MAEVNEAFDYDRSDRDAHERAGIGLLSRFIGAVFLVLLSGLLLLDRSLLEANQSQAALDAQSTALLVESYISSEAMFFGRVGDIARKVERGTDSTAILREMLPLVKDHQGLRSVWVRNPVNGRIVSFTPGTLDSLTRARIAKLQNSARGSLAIGIVALNGHHPLIGLTESAQRTEGQYDVSGMVLDETGLQAWLSRLRPRNRLALEVISGNDTIVFVGASAKNAESPVVEQRAARLPTGGTWTVSVRHATTTRSLRWALWALGVTGVLFLALGLLREQRRVIEASGRSHELERLYRDVKRANQAKSEFLANVSHELRTPLNAIVGFVELLREGFYGDLSPRQVLPVDRIAASATHLRHLVDQVLDIAKIAAGRLEVHSETIVLRPFVLNTVSELESLVSEKGLTFSITVSTSLPRVRTDPTHLRQILINLIGNAVKYTPSGTISVRARLVGAPAEVKTSKPSESRDGAVPHDLDARAPRSGIWIALQVVDTGVGIAAADLERIFDEFEQVNAGPRGDSMQRGTGLGLPISRRLARLLGGEIGVESSLGEGSTFTIWLPVNPADLRRDAAQTPTDAPAITA